jgi:hypothetical protein
MHVATLLDKVEVDGVDYLCVMLAHPGSSDSQSALTANSATVVCVSWPPS